MFQSCSALCFCLLLHVAAIGQALQLTFHQLTQENGLSPSKEYYFHQDAKGFIWIGTSGGLNRFDGKTVVKFAKENNELQSPSDNQVSSPCFEAENQDLWFSTFGTVQCFRRKTETLESWSLPGSDLKYYHAFHLHPDGNLWLRIGTGESAFLYQFNTTTKTFQQSFPIEGDQCALALDASGNPAFLIETQLPTRKGFVWRSVLSGKGSHFNLLFQANGRPRAFDSPSNGIYLEGDSLVWMGVYDGLAVFNQKTGAHFIETERTPGMPTDLGWVMDIAPLDAQKLLVSCSNGLAIFDKGKRIFEQLIEEEPGNPYSLKKDQYATLYLDASGNIWTAGNNFGVWFANRYKRKFNAVPELQEKSAGLLFEDSHKRVWCSTINDGAFVFEEGAAVSHIKTLQNMLYGGELIPLLAFTYMFQDAGGQIWGGEDNTLLKWAEKQGAFQFRLPYLLEVSNSANDNLGYVLKLRDQQIIAARGKTVYRMTTDSGQVKQQPWHDLKPYDLQVITALFQDRKGYIYVADQIERLHIFKEVASRLQLMAKISGIGICQNFCESDDSTLYAATSKGLAKLNTQSWVARLLEEQPDGIPAEQYFNVLQDKNGLLWLSGNNGLIRFDPQQKQHHRFGKADGLSSLGAGPGTFLAASNGSFWYGGKNGLNVFEPTAIQLLQSKPPIYITQIQVNDQALPPEKRSESAPLLLDFESNTISFQFAALDFSDPASIQYFYRLENVEKEWVSNGGNNTVRYPNLPPGTYTFQVKASNSDGIMSDHMASHMFTIQPPFWQTWWFYLFCTLALSALIYAWFQYRLQQALKIERMRVQISSDLHDDVGTLLAGLAMQSEALEMTAQEKDKSKLQRISEISRNAMAHMRDTVWAIDARKDKLENLLDRMREHAEETLTPRDIFFDINTEGLSLKQTLPTNIRQNLYLLFKEAVTNAAKHSNGSRVTVSLKKSVQGFEMRIADNGRTVEKAYKTTGLGTSNMQLRAEKLGGTLEISRENGFCVTLRTPGLA